PRCRHPWCPARLLRPMRTHAPLHASTARVTPAYRRGAGEATQQLRGPRHLPGSSPSTALAACFAFRHASSASPFPPRLENSTLTVSPSRAVGPENFLCSHSISQLSTFGV